LGLSMLNKILSLFVVLVVTNTAYAEEGDIPALKSQGGQFTYLEKDEPAPFEGVLLNYPAMSHFMTLPEYYQEQHRIRLQYQLGLQEEKYKFEITGLNANIDLLKAENASIIEQTDARIEMLEKELNKKTRNDRPWILAAGFAIGTGVTIGIVKALESSP